MPIGVLGPGSTTEEPAHTRAAPADQSLTPGLPGARPRQAGRSDTHGRGTNSGEPGAVSDAPGFEFQLPDLDVNIARLDFSPKVEKNRKPVRDKGAEFALDLAEVRARLNPRYDVGRPGRRGPDPRTPGEGGDQLRPGPRFGRGGSHRGSRVRLRWRDRNRTRTG